MKKTRTLALTLGDINGIGPEIALKAAYRRRWPADLRLVLVGSETVLYEQATSLGLPKPPSWTPGTEPSRKVTVWNPAPSLHPKWTPGKVRATAAQAAVAWIQATVEACRDKTFDGMITAPICKEGLKKAGLKMPGHTEFIAKLTDCKRFAMMLIGEPLRVVLVTRHIPLRRVAASINKENILETIQITHEALPWLGCKEGRIGVCGLNPHAGDGGAIGSEDMDIIRPAISAARRKRIKAEGPVPPDVIFHQAINGAYDAEVAMYHDQGLGPMKMLAFDRGINVTLGLPIIRTSPDHGTAFGIAGKNEANPRSMAEAMKLADTLSRRRNPWI